MNDWRNVVIALFLFFVLFVAGAIAGAAFVAERGVMPGCDCDQHDMYMKLSRKLKHLDSDLEQLKRHFNIKDVGSVGAFPEDGE
jgi:hypothetical protein